MKGYANPLVTFMAIKMAVSHKTAAFQESIEKNNWRPACDNTCTLSIRHNNLTSKLIKNNLSYPPIPVTWLLTTPSHITVAIAASTAEPPSCKILVPTTEH